MIKYALILERVSTSDFRCVLTYPDACRCKGSECEIHDYNALVEKGYMFSISIDDEVSYYVSYLLMLRDVTKILTLSNKECISVSVLACSNSLRQDRLFTAKRVLENYLVGASVKRVNCGYDFTLKTGTGEVRTTLCNSLSSELLASFIEQRKISHALPIIDL